MGRRRYKVGKFPAYDRLYDRRKGDSPFLNPRLADQHPDLSFDFTQKEGVLRLILEYEGQPSGEHQGQYEDLVFDAGWRDSWIKRGQGVLAAVDREFDDIKARARRSGTPPPEEMPLALVEKKLRAEAVLDITMEELDSLKKRWETRWAIPARLAQDARILAHGPAGSAWGEPPKEIDFQPVITRDGELIINCPASPYHQMRLPDYFVHVVRPFLEIKRQLLQKWNDSGRSPDVPCPIGCRFGPEFWPPRPEGL